MLSKDFIKNCIETEAISFGYLSKVVGGVQREPPYLFNDLKFCDNPSNIQVLISCIASIVSSKNIKFELIYSQLYSEHPLNMWHILDQLSAILPNRSSEKPSMKNRYIMLGNEKFKRGNNIIKLLDNEKMSDTPLTTLIITIGIQEIEDAVKSVRGEGNIPISVITIYDGKEVGKDNLTDIERLVTKLNLPIFSIASIDDLLKHLNDVEDYRNNGAVLNYYNNYCKKNG